MDEELNEKYRIRRGNKLNILQRDREKINAFLAEVDKQENKKGIVNTKVNLTDRDARILNSISGRMSFLCRYLLSIGASYKVLC